MRGVRFQFYCSIMLSADRRSDSNLPKHHYHHSPFFLFSSSLCFNFLLLVLILFTLYLSQWQSCSPKKKPSTPCLPCAWCVVLLHRLFLPKTQLNTKSKTKRLPVYWVSCFVLGVQLDSQQIRKPNQNIEFNSIQDSVLCI